MTIQKDFEEIENTIMKCGACMLFEGLSVPVCNYHQGVKQTFIEENLKRLNENIGFLEGIKIKYGLMDKQNFKELHNELIKLKSDKEFLEGKK